MRFSFCLSANQIRQSLRPSTCRTLLDTSLSSKLRCKSGWDTNQYLREAPNKRVRNFQHEKDNKTIFNFLRINHLKRLALGRALPDLKNSELIRGSRGKLRINKSWIFQHEKDNKTIFNFLRINHLKRLALGRAPPALKNSELIRGSLFGLPTLLAYRGQWNCC